MIAKELREFLRVAQRHETLRPGLGVKGTPTPCFLQECDSMGVKGWGYAKDVILKGIVVSGPSTSLRAGE